MPIHPLACVSPQATVGRRTAIGPFCIIEAGAVVGDDCELAAHVVVKAGTVIGNGNKFFEGVVVGGMPQHVHMPERPGRVVIGDNNVLREYVTIHRALAENVDTRLGNHNLLMANVHVAHDCVLGNHLVIANNVMLAGHVIVDDRAYLSGAVGVHQFCRVGSYAMVGGQAHVVKDIPPFVTVDGMSTRIVGLNRIGLRRAGFTINDISQIKAAYKLIYRSGLPWSTILDYLSVQFAEGPAAQFAEFFRHGKRGFTPARVTPSNVALVLRDDLDEEDAMPRSKAG